MVIRHGGGSGTDGDVTGSVTRSVITPAQEFAKKYRTEIGASMSSGVSTLVAVSFDLWAGVVAGEGGWRADADADEMWWC